MKQNVSRKKTLLIAIVCIAIVGIGTFFLVSSRNNSDTGDTRPVNSVDYSGPTKEEQKAGDEQKAINEKEEEAIKNNPTPTNANIFIVDASQYDDTIEVRAYISNILEDGGTCTATFTRGETSFTKTSTAFKDATTTQCGNMTIPRSDFSSAGDWRVTVSYASSSMTGQSSPKTMAIK